MEIRRRPPNPAVKVSNLEYAIPHEDSEARSILEKIVWQKDKEVSNSRKSVSLESLKSKISELPETKNFIQALQKSDSLPAVIAEIKKASPSKGVIRKNFIPKEIAISYKKGGASCLSVLTDKQFFQGGFDVLVEVRKTVDLPLLCKDFILTPYQIYQARVAGADAILLIASILSDQDLVYLDKVAKSIGLFVLVEVHDSNELERILKLESFPLIGINNRDLNTFKTDLATTESLIEKFFDKLKLQEVLVVSESGLFSNLDLQRVYAAGAKAVLVGESLMRQDDITIGLRELIGSQN